MTEDIFTETAVFRYAAARFEQRQPEQAEYDGWVFAELSTTLAAHGIQPVKSHGVMVIRTSDISAALTARAQSGEDGACGDSAGEASGRRGVSPAPPRVNSPR